MTFTTILSEGNLIPADLLEQIATGEASGQRPEDFGLEKSRRLIDEIAAAWSDAREYWSLFQRRLETLTRQGRLRADDPATSLTREFWVERLLETLGYSLTSMRSAAVVQARTYFISHRAGPDESAPPIHIEGIRSRLDQRPPSGRPRLSPHALVQEYLNATEHLWGIVTNGERLRLLRDSSRTTRPTYVEFDLRAMLEGEKFSEFAIFYRLLHRTRLPQAMDDAPRCLLERYHQQAVEAGGRVREGLRDGVEQALLALGNGLLQHPANAALREKVAAGVGHRGPTLQPLDFYRQLLRLVYRLLFLMVAEERRLVPTADDRRPTTDHRPSATDTVVGRPSSVVAADAAAVVGRPSSVVDGAAIYRAHYSITRLRRLAEQRGAGQARHGDLWLGLLATFRLLQDEEGAGAIGLAALDGDLFGPTAVPDLHDTRLSNAALLGAIRALSLYRDPRSKALRRVNYAALDVEELGSVYESLLDYRPVIAIHEYVTNTRIGDSAHSSTSGPFGEGASFALVAGSERKTTGSYYTRPELVHELIKSALEPVLEERLRAATTDHRPPTTEQRTPMSNADSRSSVVRRPSSAQEQAILSIRICDPACGSGHFLLAAARRLGRELARVRSGEDQPGPELFRLAVREVIAKCIYGVDANPLAVDLCKVALWIESLSPGMPLSFLDAHIRWGNSLIGARRDLVEQGLPDEAFQPVTGDDKAAASAFRRRNAKERKARERGQAMLPLDFGEPRGLDTAARAARQLNAMPDDSVRAVREKAAAYERLRLDERDTRALYDLWTAAFFLPLTDPSDPTIPTTQSIRDFEQRPGAAHGQMVGRAAELAQQIGFFHWELEFPDVFEGEPSTNDPRIHEYAGDESFVYSSGIRGRHGFDVVLGNPPWEMIEFVPEEFFAGVAQDIARAANKAVRDRLLEKLPQFNPDLYQAYQRELHKLDAERRFAVTAGRFPLTSYGRINAYALFGELARSLKWRFGRAGVIVPTGIATDSFNQFFFADLINANDLVSLYDFENREGFFPNVDSRMRFSLLTIGYCKSYPIFSFFSTNIQHLHDDRRLFVLNPDDIRKINPNTLTCPTFRTKVDYNLNHRIYTSTPILIDEQTNNNLWGCKGMLMFMMGSVSKMFANLYSDGLLPLYEGKMIQAYDHRAASVIFVPGNAKRPNQPVGTKNEQYEDPYYQPQPLNWIKIQEVDKKLRDWTRQWLLCFKDVTSATNERTAIFSLLPRVAVGHKAPLLFLHNAPSVQHVMCFLATMNSIVLDYVVRQKITGNSLSFYIINQLPVLPPDRFSAADIAFIVPRVLELVYTAWDMRPFAEDVWSEATTDDRPPTTDGAVAGDAGDERQDVGADSHIRPRRTATRGDAHDERDDVGANSIRPRRMTTPGDMGGERDDAGGVYMAGEFDSPLPNAGDEQSLSSLQTEILRRNAECNADAPAELFAPRDGFVLPPFRWNDERRALIRAELDARIARLYGLTRDELRYILDPADVYGPDFPGETFRVLKEKEIKRYGEYRTRRLVLEAWDREQATHE